MGSGCYFVMPNDLVSEILSRLPVKSLLRFKAVCKLWYTLINTSDFITNHHNNQNPHLFVHHYIPQINQCCFALFPDDSLVAHQDLDYIQNPPVFDQQLTGPVNGLFFFYTGCSHRGVRTALWNPATREFRSLPIPLTLTNHPSYLINQFGFGFDPFTNDYKVVWIRYHWNVDPIITLYTLANDTWRYLDIIKGSVVNSIRLIEYYTCASGVHLNGTYYWMSRSFDRSYCKFVLFDMRTHLFREIQGPEPSPYYCELVLHNDSIALLGLDDSDVEFLLDMWVMKLEGCWTKVFRVGTHLSGWPLGIWKTGEIFMKDEDSSQLILYNGNTHDCKNLGIQGNDGLCIWVFSYKESLVSVKGGSKNSDPIANLSDVLQHFFMRCCVCLEMKRLEWAHKNRVHQRIKS